IPKVVLNKLYKHTALQSTFGVNMVALVDGVNPRTLSLKQMLYHYIEHQKEVVTRRTTFELTEIQAQAILELRLRALTGLARKEIKAEHDDLIERIAELRAILADEQRLMDVIREELLEIKSRFDNPRRTEIIAAEGEIDLEQLIAEEDMVISITASGYIKRLPLGTYRTQGRGGIGVMGMDL